MERGREMVKLKCSVVFSSRTEKEIKSIVQGNGLLDIGRACRATDTPNELILVGSLSVDGCGTSRGDRRKTLYLKLAHHRQFAGI